MKCSIKKRELPPSPPTATKMVHNNQIYGSGRNTYEASVPASQIELRIPPQRSNSLAAGKEREMKVILDLARQGKTATQIAEEAGCNRNRVVQVVKQFQEYGAKLTPEKPVKKRPAATRSGAVQWTDDMVEQLITLHRQDLTYSEIGRRIGVSKNAVTGKARSLIESGVLKSRVKEIMWSAEEIETMMQLRAQGKTWGEIADKLGRKITACHNAYSREKKRRKK